MPKIAKEDVIDIIKHTEVKLDWKHLNTEDSLVEQGADSLDMISIIFAIQEKFGVQITDESIADGEWITVEKMVDNLNFFLSKRND